MSSPDDVRWGSIYERDKTFVQTTEKDVMEKGILLPQRINDTMLKYSDEIEFYYRSEVNKDSVLSAKWYRNEEGAPSLGTLQVIAPEEYAQIKAIQNTVAEILGRPDLYWENSVEKTTY